MKFPVPIFYRRFTFVAGAPSGSLKTQFWWSTSLQSGKDIKNRGNLNGSYSFNGNPDNQILMVTNSMNTKNIQYKKYIKNGIVSESDYKIIAVSTCMSKLAGDFDKIDTPIVFKALLGIGSIAIKIPIYTDKNVFTKQNEIIHTYNDNILKRNNKQETVPVSTKGFLTEDYQNISAIIYSTDKYQCPEQGHPKNLLILHNPNAAIKIPLGLFKNIKEYYVTKEGDLIKY